MIYENIETLKKGKQIGDMGSGIENLKGNQHLSSFVKNSELLLLQKFRGITFKTRFSTLALSRTGQLK